MMKSVARRVALSLSEAKRFTTLNEAFFAAYVTPTNFRWTLRSIFAPVPEAGEVAQSSITRIGAEIVDPLLKLKFTWGINWPSIIANTPLSYGTITMVVMIVSANDQIVGSGSVSLYDFNTADPGWFLQREPSRVTLNGNNVKVLKKWKRRVTPDQISYAVPSGAGIASYGQQQVQGTLSYRWRRKLTYEDEPSQYGNPASTIYLRGMNYYILCGYETTSGTASTARPYLNMDSFLYFKDP